MLKLGRDYFNMAYEISLVFAIIPFTSWLFGAITRFAEGKIISGLIRLFFGFNIVWLLDLIYMIQYRSICRVLEV